MASLANYTGSDQLVTRPLDETGSGSESGPDFEYTTAESFVFVTTNFTRLKYIDTTDQESFRYLGIIIGLLDVLFGSLGNALTILAFFKNRKLRRNVFNLFIVNLSMVDFLTATAMMPFNIAGYANMAWPFGENNITCILQAFFYFSCGYTSVVCLLAITMNRFVGIVFPDRYITLYSSKWSTVILFLSWIIAPTFLLPVLVSSVVSSFQHDPDTLLGWKRTEFLCTFVHVKAWSSIYMQILRVIFQFLPLVLMVTAYLVIVQRVHASNERLRQNSNLGDYQEKIRIRKENSVMNRNDDVTSRDVHEQQSRVTQIEMKTLIHKKNSQAKVGYPIDIKDKRSTRGCVKKILGICQKNTEETFVTKKIKKSGSMRSQRSVSDRHRWGKEVRLMYLSVIICITFTILFLPSLIVNLHPRRATLDPRYHMAASNITWLNSCVNPFIYVALHRRMRQEYKKIIIQCYNSIVSFADRGAQME